MQDTPEVPENDQSLLELPHPYIVPGERFYEAYYWDTYWIARGLAAAGKWQLVEGMADNYVYQINKFGFVPNANREYFVSQPSSESSGKEAFAGRSQIATYAPLVRLLADHHYEAALAEGEDAALQERRNVLEKHLIPMVQEYEFWTVGSDELSGEDGPATSGRAVKMPDGTVLSRNYDGDTPRPESYRADIHTGRKAGLEDPAGHHELYRHIRAAAESGWDFSGRWFADGKNIETIEATNILPVDLNCMLYELEATIAEACEAAEEHDSATYYRDQADKRAAAINTYFWDEEQGFYFDCHIQRGEHTDYPTMAATFPLFSGIASPEQAGRVADKLEKDFLRAGGFATSLQETGEQWDGENGWAPLHQVAITGLRCFGLHGLADKARGRWVERTEKVFEATRQFPEKLRVGELAVSGYGGEYAPQTGFGWTNAAYLELTQ